MDVLQVRLPEGITKEVDKLVKKGLYTNKSDVIRDALRKLIIKQQIGSIPKIEDSVKAVRAVREVLSKEIKSFKDVEELNKLGE